MTGITISAEQLAIVTPLVAAVNQVVVKPSLSADGKSDKIIPYISVAVGVILNCLLFGGFTGLNIVAGVVMGLTTCGGYDAAQLPRDYVTTLKGGA